ARNNKNTMNNNGMISNEEFENVKGQLEVQLRRYQQQQIEHEKLQKSVQLLRMENASEMQQILITTNEQLAKKEDELLRLRWIVQ
ncbi:hypothetical protein RFI_33381, partial [Reticulomyxa filosa]